MERNIPEPGNDKESLARELGAHHYIGATSTDVVAELQKLGGARVSGKVRFRVVLTL